jgi:hypothetical protein
VFCLTKRLCVVAEPLTEIVGAPDLYIDRGSTINLTCVVTYSPEPPAYIFWNHNDAVSATPLSTLRFELAALRLLPMCATVICSVFHFAPSFNNPLRDPIVFLHGEIAARRKLTHLFSRLMQQGARVC